MAHGGDVSGPVLPEVQMNLVTPKQPVIGRVVASRLCTKSKSNAFIRHVEIDVSGTPLENAFVAGQSFGIVAPGTDANGKPHKVRLYSLACPSWGEDGDGCVISTTPKRLIEELRPRDVEDPADDHRIFLGVCSNYLCDCKVGDEVQVTGPNGKRFLLPDDHNAHDYLFVATGTGIAPFRGMVKELLEGPAGPTTSQVHLVMGSPYTSDLLYHDLFVGLAEKHENFHYHVAISREQRPDGRRGLYVADLIEEQFDRFRPALEGDRGLIYICGILGMQVGIYRRLAQEGLADRYLTLKDEIAGLPPESWDAEAVKRFVRPTHNCMVEVY